MSGTLVRLIALTVVAAALVAEAFAQGGATGAITGTVQDPSGAFVAGADVRITNQDTKLVERTVKTGPDGSFTAPLLPVGTYTVSILSGGFAQGDFAGIVVRVTETTRLSTLPTPPPVRPSRQRRFVLCHLQRKIFSSY
jgi:hypothetical protein